MSQQTNEDWQYKTQRDPNFCRGLRGGVCNWPRGKVLGGSSTINSLIYLRGNRRDYDTWAEMGNTGWDYDSVKKYFVKFENVTDPILRAKPDYGKSGPVTISRRFNQPKLIRVLKEAVKEMGLTYHDSEQPLGYYTAATNIVDGQRCSVSKAFLTKIPNRSNLYVARYSYVTKVLINSKKEAYGVEVSTLFGKRKILAKKEVILSAGTINSPHILMNSGIGPSSHLSKKGIKVIKKLPVGENLQDHLLVLHFIISIPDYLISTRNLITETADYLLNRRGILASVDAINFVGAINTLKNSEYHDVQIFHFLHTRSDVFGVTSVGKSLGFHPAITASELLTSMKTPMLRVGPTLIKPKSRGRILLRSKDPFDRPLIRAGYLSDDGGEDLATLIEGLKYLRTFANTYALRRVGAKILRVHVPGCDSNADDDEYFECIIRSTATTIYHPVGTCKMAPSNDSSGVVDPRLRVHGIEKLRVVDASVMPVIVGVNTNGPTMMIGEKGADMIREDWGL